MKNYFLLALLFISCNKDCPFFAGKCTNIVNVKNNSSKEILFHIKSTYYQDTTLTNDRDYLKNIPMQSEIDQELKYVNKKSRNKTFVSIYFFDVDTINKYFWNEIITNFRVQKYQKMSYEELDKLDWKIAYP